MTEYLVFVAESSSGYPALWKSDGTSAGTVAIAAAPGSNFQSALGPGEEIWPVFAAASLAIPAIRHVDIAPGLVVSGLEPSGYAGLWFTDGQPLIEIDGVASAYSSGLSPVAIISYGGLAYFNGRSASPPGDLGPAPRELWRSNATVGGTVPVTPTQSDPFAGVTPTFLAVAFGQLFFNGLWPDGNQYLTFYETGAAELQRVANPPGIGNLNPYCLAVSAIGSAQSFLRLPTFLHPGAGGWSIPNLPVRLFMGGAFLDGAGLYSYDGSSLTAIDPTFYGLTPCNLVSLQWISAWDIRIGDREIPVEYLYHSAVFFSGWTNGTGARGLWTSQGTAASTVQVATTVIVGGASVTIADLEPYNLTALNGILYFSGADPTNEGGRALFAYDPVTAQTTLLVESSKFDLGPLYQPTWNGSPPTPSSAIFLSGVQAGNGSPLTMAAFNGKLFFNANGVNGVGLYSWDPTQPASNPILIHGDEFGEGPWALATANLDH